LGRKKVDLTTKLGHEVPRRYVNLAREAEGTSRKKAIRAFCLECCAWDPVEVDLCTAKKCFLWKWRKSG
jgi:hypothetical protein